MFVQEFQKIIAVYETSTLEFLNFQIYAEKQKGLALRAKHLICVLLGKNFKKLISFLKSAPLKFSISKI